MPVKLAPDLTAPALMPRLRRVVELSGRKILSLGKSWDPSQGTPVFTAGGKYTSRGWTEWTQGFQFGSALLQFDLTGEKEFLELGRSATFRSMAAHVSHVGVHDHGFNNISTYGALLRLMLEGKFGANEEERRFYELALKASGAVQAARWTSIADGTGYIYSFNGPHSLFIDTMRSLRSLAAAYLLGHPLMGEHDEKISLLQRLIDHARATARYNIYYGTGRDAYDVSGRTAHESIFNLNDGRYRCPSSQQGYSPFTTWTRGLAWAICGYAEQLEFLAALPPGELESMGGFEEVTSVFLKAARAAADFYLESTPVCGVPLWDTGAPEAGKMEGYLNRRADPYNSWEPFDSSAAVIAAQGLLRLGNFLTSRALGGGEGERYRQAALTIAETVFDEPYLAVEPNHQGLILHSVYHRPNGWDYVAPGRKIPNGESSMWGDYHARELALLLWREARKELYPTFFGAVLSSRGID